MRTLHQIWRGMNHLPYCGSHPGNIVMIVLAIIGYFSWQWWGVMLFVGTFAPFYLTGCLTRAQSNDRIELAQKGLDYLDHHQDR